VESHRIEEEGELPIPSKSAQRVLVDAPCSGSGTWRRNGTARWNAQSENIDAFRELQGRILQRASSLVAPEGRLIYATCSLLKAENEDVVDRFLQDNPGWAIMNIREVPGGHGAVTTGNGLFLKTFPHRHGCDAFFAAVLVPDK
jgi:16S rRNA (cytosine967-C5)-methyltransferase